MTKPSEAKKTYAKKVCGTYLGISEEACKGAFGKLISNMKAGLKAFT